MIWWNGEPLPVPSSPIQCEKRIVEGTNSGQTLGGSYSKKVIARKEDVRLTWVDLSAEDCVTIAKINGATYGKLTYYSPSAGAFVTRTMHVESYTEDLTEADISAGKLSGSVDVAVQLRER